MFKNEEGWKLAKFKYDFAEDGGAVGAISLRGEALPVGAIVRSFMVVTKVDPTSGGAATLQFGYSGDADADSGATGAVAYSSFTTSAPFSGNSNGESRTWDDTNDAGKLAYISSVAEGTPEMTVAAAALTAGKFEVFYEYFIPEDEL